MGVPQKGSIGTARRALVVLCNALWLAIAIGLSALPSPAQDQTRKQVSSSDLTRENLSQVAASAGDIKAVLLKNSGLMVELKRWIAKDAADHGQLIGESDLTTDAIFARLENDVRFRSVATLLLQRYGYLIPEVNPASQLGKEQELLVQERVKWISQHEEQAREQEETQAEQAMQKAHACESGVESNCPQQQQSQTLPAHGSQQEQQLQQSQPALRPNPNAPEFPVFPQPANNPLERAQLMQAGSESGGDFSQLGLGGGFDSMQTLGGLGGGMSPSLFQQLGNGQDEEPGLSGMGGNRNLQSSFLGLNGGGLEGAFDQFDQNDINPFEMSGAREVGSSSAAARQLLNRQNQQQAVLRPVDMVRAPNPYQDIPSLYDMYMQAVPRPSTPQRFGIDVFKNGRQDPDLIPMDLPAGPDYVVGPGDGLAIDLWGGVSRKLYRTVDKEGRISLPEVGPVLVSGKSLSDVQQNLQQVLRTQFRDESADVSLARLRTIRVYEVGDVTNPGAYDISSLSTALNALFVAGGPTLQGSLRLVKHFRGNQLIETVDLYELLLHGVKTGMDRLDNGDTILVPPVGPQVTIEGMVRRPAIYELKDEKSLASVLELAGGLLPTAAIRHIEVERLVAHQKQTMLSLDIPDVGDTSEVTKKLETFQIQDGDRIRIFPIASGNEDAIYLEGHVVRPGRYSYRPDMRVTDVITSYKDLLPEPAAQYAEIIHLNAPDFRPSVESFDLADALADPSHAPVLHPMDTVQIFSRFDFENPPSVTVLGDVRMPGSYRASGQIHLSDAIHLAGGLAPDAEVGDAQVFRYLPDGKSKIFSVNLSQALEGDPAENIILQPRDRLLIHRNMDAAQPATVYAQGAVANPGRYPLTANMTVADLIRVSGGLKPSADTQVGDLTRFQLFSQKQMTAQHDPIEIAAALHNDPKSNLRLDNGDVVTIRELPGWDDLGASITLKGEVEHPGTYGIRPGERLSSVLERAGGFQPNAYPYGAIFERIEVRDLESSQQDQLILRVKEAQSNLEQMPAGTPQQQQARELTLQQYQTTLTQLTSNPPLGRVDIRISSDIKRWRNTSSDIEVRTGDTLIIPKKPSYVMVTGSVFNPTAVSYRPGKSAKWYLGQSGGPTQLANKKSIFVIRADGSVIGANKTLLVGDSFNAVLLPGDTIVVPEKAIGGGPQWANLFTAAQVASSVVSTMFIALHY